MYKQFYKGPDRATMEISGGMQDKIKAYLNSCFIGPTEACWKIFEFNMHGESPAVQRLPIHLSNEHYVNFHAHQTVNVYSDDCHSAVKFMLDQIIDIPNLLYMGGNFNIRDVEWDPSVFSHPAAGQALVDLADSLGLVCSLPELPVPTHYSATDGHANLVIDLIFRGMSCAQVLHRIEPDLR